MVQRLAHTIAQLKAKTSSGTLHDKEVKRQVKMPADREPEVKAITVGNKDGNVQATYCSILWREGKHKCSPRKEATQRPMIEALNNTLPRMDTEALSDKQGEVKVKALLNARVDT